MDAYDELASGAPAWYAVILTVLGRGRHDEALRQAREQLTIAKENSDKNGQMFAMRLIAKAQLGKGDSWNAKKTADETVTLAKSMGDQKAIAGAMHMLAKAEVKEKNLDAAVAAANEAESGYKGLNFQAGVAAVMSTVASVEFARKDVDKALETANAAKEKFKEAGDLGGQASALKVAVDIKMAEDRYYHALLLVEEMINLYNEGNDLEGEAAAQLLAAELQVTQGDLQNAMDRASASAERFEQVNDSKKKAQAVLVMAKAFQGADQMQDASQAADAATALFQEARDKRGMAAALVVGAECQISQTQYGAAAYKLEEATFVWRQLKDKKMEAELTRRLADTQVKMLGNMHEMPLSGWSDAEKEKAIANGARAAELYEELGQKTSVERAQAMMAEATGLSYQDRQEEAIAKAGEAQTIYQDLNDTGGQAWCLMLTGNAYNARQKYEAAIEAFEKARELVEDGGEGPSVKDVSNRIKDIGRQKDASKTGADGSRMDIQIIKNEVPIIDYDAFESRQMRTGAPPSSSSVSLAPGDAGYAAPTKAKVLYNLRMQRVPNVDMVIPEAITA